VLVFKEGGRLSARVHDPIPALVRVVLGERVRDVAADLGVNPSTLWRWSQRHDLMTSARQIAALQELGDAVHFTPGRFSTTDGDF
jgi:hypothetical protein